MKIPKIIHQIWSDIEKPLPEEFKVLGETWKRDYPDWEYILWDDKMMNDFISEHYPQCVERYNSFPYNVQRWDAIRYLILDKIGGMYVDCDYESIESMDAFLADKTCCFAMEPASHRHFINSKKNGRVISNAMMLSVPNHFFFKKLINSVFGKHSDQFAHNKFAHVMTTTGPYCILDSYDSLTPEEQEHIYLIPAKYVMPFDYGQIQRFRHGEESDELEEHLQEAYAIHYFFGEWVPDTK
jgi:mannosyltransferase OCH1-like enzyme